MKKQENRGITLVALIITIIVMLILVAVTVTVVVDSDIIEQAEKAGGAYKDAYANEGNKVSDETIEGEGLRHNTVEGYMQDICEHNFVDGECTKCEKECTHDFGADGKCIKCGGLNLINFTMCSKQYTAIAGMTFEDWVESEYNTDGFYFDEWQGTALCNSKGVMVWDYYYDQPALPVIAIDITHRYDYQ